MQQACGAGAEIANASGAKIPTSMRVSSSLAVRRCIDDPQKTETKDKLDEGTDARLGFMADFHALPRILAHHQRTPTNKKRQS
jgi:hypothetical protein